MNLPLKRTFIPPSHRPYINGTKLRGVSTNKTIEFDQKKKRKIISIGTPGDPQFDSICENVDYAFAWGEFGLKWDITMQSHEVRINNLLTGSSLQVDADTVIYSRFPFDSFGDRRDEVYSTFLGLCSDNLVNSKVPEDVSSQKLLQLPLLKGLAPVTNITNSDLKKGSLGDTIVKSMSQFPTQISTSSSLLERKLHLPTLFQTKIEGHEFKAHIFFKASKFWHFTVQVSSNVLDYRHQEGVVRYHEVDSLPEVVKKLIYEIHDKTKLFFFDIDFFVEKNGNVKVLEWNTSPCPSVFEDQLGKEQLFTRLAFSDYLPVTISSSEDKTMQEFSHYAQKLGGKILNLQYESLGVKWDFFRANGIDVFVVENSFVLPKRVYHRHSDCDPNSPQGHRIYLLKEFVDSFDDVIGQTKENHSNWSKPYQIAATLVPATQAKSSVMRRNIFVPNTVICKGRLNLEWEFRDWIVKSISGVRSIVVDGGVFEKWDASNLFSIPVMFQEKMAGPDVRIHYLDDKMWSVIVEKKNCVDYRYSCSSDDLKSFEPDSEVLEFVADLAKKDNNRFIGVDFIKTNSAYVCLESNPGPGWNWFDRNNTTERSLKQWLYQILIS